MGGCTIRNGISFRIDQLKSEYPLITQTNIVQQEVLKYIAKKFGNLTSCCLYGAKSPTQCDDCITAYDVKNQLIESGYEPWFLGTIVNGDTLVDQYCLCPLGIATVMGPKTNKNRRRSGNINFIIDGVEYNLEAEMGIGFSGNFTTNKTICNPEEFSTQADVNVHFWENPVAANEDVVFVKLSGGGGISSVPSNHKIIEKPLNADSPPPFQYKLVHRSFAPWNRFGHLPIFPTVHVLRNSFRGDNRGFSLGNTDLFSQTTARIHHKLIFELGSEEEVDSELYSSQTIGFVNFKRKKIVSEEPNPFKEELVIRKYESVKEEFGFCEPDGFDTIKVINNITYTAMFFEGSDPLIKLPLIAPDIEWYLEMATYFLESDSTINISARVIGKEFPAYEAYIEDNCMNKLFLHTYAAPCESDLAGELMNPFPDYNEGFELKIPVDSDGCFKGDVILSGSSSISIENWNQTNLSKSPAQDCPASPCQGAYPDNNNDNRSQYGCG